MFGAQFQYCSQAVLKVLNPKKVKKVGKYFPLPFIQYLKAIIGKISTCSIICELTITVSHMPFQGNWFFIHNSITFHKWTNDSVVFMHVWDAINRNSNYWRFLRDFMNSSTREFYFHHFHSWFSVHAIRPCIPYFLRIM